MDCDVVEISMLVRHCMVLVDKEWKVRNKCKTIPAMDFDVLETGMLVRHCRVLVMKTRNQCKASPAC